MGKKKDISPKLALRLSERYVQFCQGFEKASNKVEFLYKFFHLDTAFSLLDSHESPTVTTATNNDLRIIAFCKNKDIQKILLELGDKGADIVAIYDRIKPKLSEHELENFSSPLWPLMNAELHPNYNEVIAQADVGFKEYQKRRRALKNAVKLICGLRPIRMDAADELRKHHPDFNSRLAAVQKELEDVVNLYIEYTPFFRNKAGKISGYFASHWARPISKIRIPKEVTSKSDLWNDKIVAIVKELRRVGFSGKQAYKKTMDLFTLAFPEIWRDNDPDLIRQRYTYHTKTK